MISDVCRHLKNYFSVDFTEDDFTVNDGSINLPFLKEGQYFNIEGSTFNDGVHLYPTNDLKDETFHGIITSMAVPNDFIALCDEIEEWQKKNGAINSPNMSPFQSESFGGYSYSKGASTNGSTSATWKDAFRSRLNDWRKL